MRSIVTMTRQLWKALFGTRGTRGARGTRPAPRTRCRRLGLEILEDRVTPSLWVGTAGGTGGLWSNPANWVGGVPTNGGIVVFSPVAGGTNTPSVDDIPGLSLGQMTIDSSYTQMISLNQTLQVALTDQ